MTLTSTGVIDMKNLERGKKTLDITLSIATAARFDTTAPTGRTNYVIEAFLRSTYAHNEILVFNFEGLNSLDKQVCHAAFKKILKYKDKGIG